MEVTNAERRLSGAADMLGLLARAFAYPDEELSSALADGRFQDDARAFAGNLGIDHEADEALQALDAYRGRDAVALYKMMRRSFSRMYLVPGDKVPVFPYEGPFLFVSRGQQGHPSLFRNRAAVDVLRRMREAGVAPEGQRGEPADSIWFELAFLSFAYANRLDALCRHGRFSDEERLWQSRAQAFVEAHGAPWMVAFMERTQAVAPQFEGSGVYGDLARLAQVSLESLFADISHESKVI